MNGHWREGPGLGLFEALSAQLGEVPILAEDLGVITTDVVQLRLAALGRWSLVCLNASGRCA